MRKPPAKPVVRFYTNISVEADALRRHLQAQMRCSANQLAERALRSLAAEQIEPATPAEQRHRVAIMSPRKYKKGWGDQ
jgi:predicted RNA-binding protein Jag